MLWLQFPHFNLKKQRTQEPGVGFSPIRIQLDGIVVTSTRDTDTKQKLITINEKANMVDKEREQTQLKSTKHSKPQHRLTETKRKRK